MNRLTLLIRWAVFAAVLLALPQVTWAQRTAYQAEGEVARLLQDARSYYDNLELESADDALRRSIGLIERFRLQSPTVAEVYIQRGILVHVRDRDANAATQDFVRALVVDSQARLDPLVSTPSLERLFEDARRKASAQQPRQPEPVYRQPREPVRPPPRRGEPITHQAPRQLDAGKPFDVRIELDQSVNSQAYRVNLFFRSVRAELVQKRELRAVGASSFQGRIPGRFIAGRQLSYYITVEDRLGRPIAQLGTPKAPLAARIRGGALAALDDIPSGSSLNDGGGWDDDDGASKRHYVTMSLHLGTGGGFITDRAEPETLTDKAISPGFAAAPFHTLIELDFWPHERFAISAFARVQIIEFAHIEGGRLKFKAVDTDAHDLILRAGGGFGRTRHLVDLQVGLDTTLEGPYMYTLGLSYEYAFSDRFQLLITPDFLHMIGDSPSLHFDLGLGLQVGF